MKCLTLLVSLLALGLAGNGAQAGEGAAAAGQYRNLFQEYLGKSESETTARLGEAERQLFDGDPDSQRLFYPVAGDMMYVPDIGNNDVRTEGLSYGMMICVQLDQQRDFNRIWKYAKRHMYHSAGPLRGYFAWHTAFDGHHLSPGPAPDGEEWFVMDLFFASHRWGDGEGILNYSAEAQALLHTMLHKHEEAGRGEITDMYDRDAKQVVFVPAPPGARFTDPSYHLPQFTELWSRWARDPADQAFLREVTAASRQVFHRAANPRTGLMPDYANFDGTPFNRFGHSDFRYDAWRTLCYPALDWSWWAADPWQVEQSNRVLGFLSSHGDNVPDRYQVDGTPVSSDVNSPGLVAMAATAALAADRAHGEPWVRKLWAQPMPSGHGRYYNGLLTMLALLEVGGRFRIYGPTTAP
ncbi:MAG TPA: glycosyl hydrolase family 8 [Candidatus Didemnitutus sp.]|jgi:oligosaccharide reducing-end xylanase